MSDLNRRDFMFAAAGVAAACLVCGGATVCDAADTDTPAGKIDAGPVATFTKDGAYDQLAKDNKVLVYRSNGKLYAATAQCTHRKVLLKVVDGQARCPAHGSRFDADGKPVRGPANKSLVRYGVSVDAAGHLIIDMAKTFEESKWSDAGASVAAA